MTTKKLTPKWVEMKLREIRDAAGDPETAHSMEDTLWQEVLEAIAMGYCSNIHACARLALSSQQIHFERWYA